MKGKLAAAIIMLLLFTSCATQHFDIRDQAGRNMPYPMYELASTEHPIYVKFYYAKMKVEKDVDLSEVAVPEYLTMFKFHDIDTEEFYNVMLTIEVFNPEELKYTIREQNELQVGEMRYEAQSGGILNISDKKYRMFVYNLPMGENIRMVQNTMVLSVDNDESIRIGTFRYNLIK